jgi:hypothetical protein
VLLRETGCRKLAVIIPFVRLRVIRADPNRRDQRLRISSASEVFGFEEELADPMVPCCDCDDTFKRRDLCPCRFAPTNLQFTEAP